MENLSTPYAANDEQHELVETIGYDLLLASLNLENYKVLELGFGQGSLSQLIMKYDPIQFVGVEINKNLTPSVSGPNVTLRYGDLRLGIYDFLNDGKWVLICNPPYSCLDFIKEEILDKYS